VQTRGIGGASELADLPEGMKNDAAKEYVESLNMDQGKDLFVSISYIPSWLPELQLKSLSM
jgi:hypothetical protein